MKIKTNIKEVEEILQDKPICRENDFILFFHLLLKLGVNPEEITAGNLLRGMYEKKYPHFESVRRTRQLLQEKNINLRGVNYIRLFVEKEKVENELGYIKTPFDAGGMRP